MQAQQKLFNKIVFTLLKSFHNAVSKCDPLGSRPLLPCFSSFSSVQFSRCSLKDEPSKLNNARGQKRLTLGTYAELVVLRGLLRKEVIQPLVLERLPCYDFTPITKPTFGRVLLAVRLRTSGVPGSHGVTGGVYKARERIHRGMLIHDY